MAEAVQPFYRSDVAPATRTTMDRSGTVLYCNPFVLTDAALLITYRFLLEFVFGPSAAAEKPTAVWIVGPWLGYTLLALAVQLRPMLRTRKVVVSTRTFKGRQLRPHRTVDDVDMQNEQARLAVAGLADVVFAPQLLLLFASEEAMRYLVATAALYAIMLPRVHQFLSVGLVPENVLDLHQLAGPIRLCAIVVDLLVAASMAAVVASHRTSRADINKDADWMIAKVFILILYLY